MKSRSPGVFLLVTLLFFSSLLRAQTRPARSETYRDLIEKAQNLVLQKDRQQAMNILMNALRRETPKSMAAQELKKNLNDIGVLFFSDKTQQSYEVGITLKRTDLGQAQQKIGEALRLEPDNLQLLVEQVRVEIAKGECSTAEENAQRARQLDAYLEELNLAYVQASICHGVSPEAQKLLDGADLKRSPLAKFWLMAKIEIQIKNKNYVKAGEELALVRRQDPQYPEIPYWEWKLDALQKKQNAAAAEKYAMACKNISAHLYRQYMMDPMLCRHLSEVEPGGSEP